MSPLNDFPLLASMTTCVFCRTVIWASPCLQLGPFDPVRCQMVGLSCPCDVVYTRRESTCGPYMWYANQKQYETLVPFP